MSQKKRGSNPIRITLTEDQIADIIQSAAKTRRTFSAQRLEDRIAPSAIGGPILDPTDPGFDGNPDNLLPPLSDGTHPQAPLPGDPPLPGDAPPLPGDVAPPPAGPVGGGPVSGTPDAGPVVPDGGNQAQGFDQPSDALYPNLPPGSPGGPFTAPGGIPDPSQHVLGGGSFGSHLHTQAHGGPTFDQLMDQVNSTPAGQPLDPHLQQQLNDSVNNYVDHQLQNATDQGGTLPSAQEIDEHRRNILRQLRGGH